jgi:hypothetical protein
VAVSSDDDEPWGLFKGVEWIRSNFYLIKVRCNGDSLRAASARGK